MTPAGARANSFEVTTVDDDGAGSLRAAIAAANADPDADVITFAANVTGTIKLTTGQLQILYSVDIQGPGAEKLTVSGNDASRVFYMYAEDPAILDVSISGLTVSHGADDIGSGIVNYGEHLTLDGVVVTNNHSTADGGGIWADGFDMTLTIHNSVISGNVSDDDGGGIYIEDTNDNGGQVLIEGTQITGNQAAGDGGGIYLCDPDGDLTIEKSVISGNVAGDTGGGIYLYSFDDGTFTLRETTISNNQAESAGGIYLYGVDHPTLIENCTISGNQATAGDGGGIFLYNVFYDSLTVTDSTISSNSSQANGGGLFVHSLYDGSTLTVTSSTIATNSAAANGGGVLQVNPDTNRGGQPIEHGTFVLTNSIVGDNTAATNPDLQDDFAANYCLIEDATGANITGGNNLTGTDAALGALADNGGPTQTHLPGATSPALDAGDPAFASPPDKDQRGFERVVGAHIDIGAVERNPGTLVCSVATLDVSESAGNATIVVTRTGGADGAIAVDYATEDDAAVAPGDYTAANGTLNWSNQDSASKMFQVPIVDDTAIESNEPFTAGISHPTAGATLGATTAVTVTITNDDDDAAPAIGAIDDVEVDEDHATSALPFTVGDPDDAATTLTVTATSSNHDLVPEANVALGGSGASRTVKVTPLANQHGSALITVTVSDGTNSANETFTVTVNAVNDAPTITPIDDQAIDENESTAALSFTLGDPDTDVGDLVVSAKSSKQALVDNDDITLGGSGTHRTIKVKPLKDETGSVDITITVNDGSKITATTFTLVVNKVTNDPDSTGGSGGKPAGNGGAGGSGGSMMMPDAGMDGSGGKGSGTGVPIEGGKDAGGSANGSGSHEQGDEDDAGMPEEMKHKDDGGCSATGSTQPASFWVTMLLSVSGLVSRRRKRRPQP